MDASPSGIVHIAPSDGKGLGVFASRDIQAGEVIVEERVMVANTHVKLDGKVWSGVSNSWGLVATMALHGQPDFVRG